MNPPRRITFGGHRFKVTAPAFGKGGQGTVHKLRRYDDASLFAVAKELPKSPETEKRVERLIDLGIGLEIPFTAAPIAMTPARGKPALYYLTPFSTGISLEDDRPRPFPELLEMAVVLAATWENLEKHGIAHGDIAPSNLLVRDDGTIDLIDFDNYALADGSVPPPTMIGQHPMIAPDLRAARDANIPVAPDLTSDRFAWAVIFNILLLGRYPADGLADTPKKLDRILSSGKWPEEQRSPLPGETPITAMGRGLRNLFRQGFSTSPLLRPDAETWRRGFTAALDQLHIHACGNAFVLERGMTRCPVCGGGCEIKYIGRRLIARNLGTGTETEFDLAEGTPIYLGRDTLPGLSPYVSGRHVRIYLSGGMLHLKQIGGNGSSIEFPGSTKKFKLVAFHEAADSPRLSGATLTLIDFQFQIQIA